MHEVVRVERDERKRAQRLPQGFELLVEPRRLRRHYEGNREPVSPLPVGVHVPAELQTTLTDEARPCQIIPAHPRTLAESRCHAPVRGLHIRAVTVDAISLQRMTRSPHGTFSATGHTSNC